MNNIKKAILACLSIVILLTGCGKKNESENDEPKTDETISLVAIGDNLLHMQVINSGKQSDGTYDFSHIFKNLNPIFKDADIAVINQETMFGGDDRGFSGYPAFNSPTDMGRNLVDEGFDVILHATNHTMDKGSKGVENAIEFWKEFPDINVLGINASEEEQNTVEIREVKGAKLALLNYTYGTNGIPVPEGKEYIVNLIDEEKIEKDALYAEKNADFTIAFMHWGIEYSTKPSDEQRDLAKKMCEWGVDLIIGAHPHVLQPIEWFQSSSGNFTLVYYSLGNFVSSQRDAINMLGGLADVKLHYDGEDVIISDYSMVPLVTHYGGGSSNFTVYKLDDYSDDLAAKHGVAAFDGRVTVERFEKMLDDINGEYEVVLTVG